MRNKRGSVPHLPAVILDYAVLVRLNYYFYFLVCQSALSVDTHPSNSTSKELYASKIYILDTKNARILEKEFTSVYKRIGNLTYRCLGSTYDTSTLLTMTLQGGFRRKARSAAIWHAKVVFPAIMRIMMV